MYIIDDGGKSETNFKGDSDCGVRAVAIACGIHYLNARKLLKVFAKVGKQGNAAISTGIYKENMDAALKSLGWEWCAAPKFDGRKARYTDLPTNTPCIARMAKHYVAVVDGHLHDTWDSSEKMVYGYWTNTNTL